MDTLSKIGQLPLKAEQWRNTPEAAWEQKARGLLLAVAALVLPLIAICALQAVTSIVPGGTAIHSFAAFLTNNILGASAQTYLLFYTLFSFSSLGLFLLIEELVPEKCRNIVYKTLIVAMPFFVLALAGTLMVAAHHQEPTMLQSLTTTAARAGMVVAGATGLAALAIVKVFPNRGEKANIIETEKLNNKDAHKSKQQEEERRRFEELKNEAEFEKWKKETASRETH